MKKSYKNRKRTKKSYFIENISTETSLKKKKEKPEEIEVMYVRENVKKKKTKTRKQKQKPKWRSIVIYYVYLTCIPQKKRKLMFYLDVET